MPRCDAPDIDQGRDCATAAYFYDGRMRSNPGGGTWVHAAFTEQFFCHRCDPIKKNCELPSALVYIRSHSNNISNDDIAHETPEHVLCLSSL